MICLGRKKGSIECGKKMGCTINRRPSDRRRSKTEPPAEKRSFDELCVESVLECLDTDSLETIQQVEEGARSTRKKGKVQEGSEGPTEHAVQFKDVVDAADWFSSEHILNSALFEAAEGIGQGGKCLAEMHRNFSLEFNEVWPAVESTASPTSVDALGIGDRTGFVSTASKLCLFRFCCYRKSRRTNRATSNSQRLPYEEYSRLSQCSSDVMCSITASSFSTDSSCLSNATPSRTLQSESLSGNLSEDSGFDESQCFLSILMHDHVCTSQEVCNRKKYACLNAHLRNLIECMPKSFCDCEAKQNAPFGLQRGGFPSRRWSRRNAVCETSVEMRARFTEALRALLTLRAMLKYDFL